MATRLERLAARRTDPTVTTAKHLSETWRTIQESDSVKYIIGAMQPIDPEYTKNTFAQGDRVRNQLEQHLTLKCEYEYQGSTTNDTHIKAASDIDLLVVTSTFYSVQPPQIPQYPYAGDCVKDMNDLRGNAARILRSAFPKATVDSTGSKSIVVTGGSLTRKVDVVPANWWNTNKYAETGSRIYRGVEIFDSKAGQRIANTPFLHNAMVEARDRHTRGGLRKAARLMKSLKYDSESIDLSSYDLVAIAYNVPPAALSVPKEQDLLIAGACHEFVRALCQDEALRNSIMVPDEHRPVFSPGHATRAGLHQLMAELQRLVTDVLNENQRSFRRLAEARVAY